MLFSVRETQVDVPCAVVMESARERVVKVCREKCPPRHCKGAGSMCVKVLLVLVNFSFLVCPSSQTAEHGSGS